MIECTYGRCLLASDSYDIRLLLGCIGVRVGSVAVAVCMLEGNCRGTYDVLAVVCCGKDVILPSGDYHPDTANAH